MSWNSAKAPSQSSASHTGNPLSSQFVYIFFIPYLHYLLLSCSPFYRFIHRELVLKNVYPQSTLPIFLLDWVDQDSDLCVYTTMQLAKFPRVHLVAGGWYLDCSRGFVPDVEKYLYNNLVTSAP
jgi:hypothetical protein